MMRKIKELNNNNRTKKQGHLALLFLVWRADTCYVSKILTAGSEPVISFLNRTNSFCGVCLFCIFVRNTIYVIENDVLEPVFMARYLKFGYITIYMINRII